MEEHKYGGLIDKVSKEDYRLGNDNSINIPANTNTIKHYYNQYAMRGKVTSEVYNPHEDTRRSCVLFGIMGTISDLTGYKFTQEDILAINKDAMENYGLKIKLGMRFTKGIDCIRKYRNNKFPNDKLISFRVTVGDDDYNNAIDKNHTLIVGYGTSTEYFKDSQDDGILQGDNFEKGSGHCVRVSSENDIDYISDNYDGIKGYNVYQIDHIEILKNNRVYFANAYLILKDKTIEEEIRDNIKLESAKRFYDRGLTNGLYPKEKITREEVMALCQRNYESIIKELTNK